MLGSGQTAKLVRRAATDDREPGARAHAKDVGQNLPRKVQGRVHIWPVVHDSQEDDAVSVGSHWQRGEVFDVDAIGHDQGWHLWDVLAEDHFLPVRGHDAASRLLPASQLLATELLELDPVVDLSHRRPLRLKGAIQQLVLDVVLVYEHGGGRAEVERAHLARFDLDDVEPLSGQQPIDGRLHRGRVQTLLLKRRRRKKRADLSAPLGAGRWLVAHHRVDSGARLAQRRDPILVVRSCVSQDRYVVALGQVLDDLVHPDAESPDQGIRQRGRDDQHA